MKSTVMFLVVMFVSVKSFAHGDHGIPGAVAPAPHGGVLMEAKHVHTGSHKHDHMVATKREIFFEAKLKGDVLKIYALELNPKGHKSFLQKDISQLKEAEFKISDPRKKANVLIKIIPKKDHWTGSLKGVRGRRFIIDATAIYKGAKYKAQLQVERK